MCKSHPVLKNLSREDISVDCLPKQNVLLLWAGKGKSKLLAVMNFSEAAQRIFLDDDQKWLLIFDSQSGTTDSIALELTQSSHELMVPAHSGLLFESMD